MEVLVFFAIVLLFGVGIMIGDKAQRARVRAGKPSKPRTIPVQRSQPRIVVHEIVIIKRADAGEESRALNEYLIGDDATLIDAEYHRLPSGDNAP